MSRNRRGKEEPPENSPELMVCMGEFHHAALRLIERTADSGISLDMISHWLVIEQVCALKEEYEPKEIFARIVLQLATTIQFYTGEVVVDGLAAEDLRPSTH
jgi:predicted transcriptional regulator